MGLIRVQQLSSAELGERAKMGRHRLKNCTLCPRKCRVNRRVGETGICTTGEKAWVSSFSPHLGEEAPLVGNGGSGTIFFTHCSLNCCFCQNFDISQQGEGRPVTVEQLAEIMIQLQNRGCCNINFVTPSHVIPQIIASVEIAVENGLSIPLVYNSSGYDEVRSLKLLDGIIDIYMPDFKFWDSNVAEFLTDAPDYPEKACAALKEMHRQVGDLVLDGSGLAVSGLLVRHLILPEGKAGTRDIMRFVASEISENTYVNIMAQYHPYGEITPEMGISRRITPSEYQNAVAAAETERIFRLDRR